MSGSVGTHWRTAHPREQCLGNICTENDKMAAPGVELSSQRLTLPPPFIFPRHRCFTRPLLLDRPRSRYRESSRDKPFRARKSSDIFIFFFFNGAITVKYPILFTFNPFSRKMCSRTIDDENEISMLNFQRKIVDAQ